MNRRIDRRTALKHMGVAAGAAAIAPRLLGCSSDGGSGGPPDAGGPGKITHFVEICMENRSYDHWLGSRKLLGKPVAGDGLVEGMSNKRGDGSEVKIYPADVMCVADPPHGWDSAHRQFNDGMMDGFLSEYQASQGVDIVPAVMEYMTPDQIPWTSALLEQSTVCDRWFSGMMGPTWPNRLYLHSAQCGGLKANQLPASGGFDWPTVYHNLNKKQVPWTYYWSDLPVASLWEDLSGEYNIRRIQQFFDDAEAGTLPPVTVVEPAFGANDDHPPHHPLMGQQFLASVFAALATSPLWNHMLIVITYDEQGGFYDHVAPPKFPDDRAADGFDQAGFRVPTIIAGPYAKRGFVDSTVREHSSVVKHISTMFDLPPLTMRDAAAADLMAAIDLDRLAANEPAPPPTLPQVTVDESMLDDACTKTSKRYAGYHKADIELLADTGFFGERDARKDLPETLRLMAEQLEKRGMGGYRRGK
jgi:phospholipase C